MQLTDDLRNLVEVKPLIPFDEHVLDFFNDLAKNLVKVRDYSDVATFGFWCRKSNLIKEKKQYDDLNKRLGRGIVFHSTPSNVPVNFAFSLAAGLLAGNVNIIRLPGKDFEQVDIITNAINKLLDNEYKDLKLYINFVKYAPDRKMHNIFSSICDVRVIWGGDGTINEIRQSPLKPTATEITFADRYSIALVNGDKYLELEDKSKLAQDFYNDTYFSDQNACTAPRIIFWLGEQKVKAKIEFWKNLRVLVENKYELLPVQSVGKLNAFYKVASEKDVNLIKEEDLYITRIDVKDVDHDLMEFKYNSGFFFETDINNLEDIYAICNQRLQTLTYFGIEKEEIENFILKSRLKGIDRVVPVGKSMDFTLVWDGYDLIRALSKKIL